jgi:hypothetical protein
MLRLVMILNKDFDVDFDHLVMNCNDFHKDFYYFDVDFDHHVKNCDDFFMRILRILMWILTIMLRILMIFS